MSANAALFRNSPSVYPAQSKAPIWATRTSACTTVSLPPFPAETKVCGVLMLTPGQQSAFVAELPETFESVPGGWGRKGCTLVCLPIADETVLLGALTTAYRNADAKQSAKRKTPRRSF